jgi:Lar family restriction alleviation protein
MDEHVVPLPCPFCGGVHLNFMTVSRRVVYEDQLDDPYSAPVDTRYRVMCEDCGGDGPVSDEKSYERAIVAWNDRMPYPPLNQ